MMIGTSDSRRSTRATSRPSIAGSARSSTIRSGRLRAREIQRLRAVVGDDDG